MVRTILFLATVFLFLKYSFDRRHLPFRLIYSPNTTPTLIPFNFADVAELKSKIGVVLAKYKNQPKLGPAAALISRLIARRAHSFRVQYGFRFLRKTNVALCRWNELNLAETLENVHDAISEYELNGEYNLPTEANFEYLLVRLQCAVKILARIIFSAKEAFESFMQFIEKGWYVDIVVIYLGVVAQVWKLCIQLCETTVHFYNDISQHLSQYLAEKKTAKLINDQLPERLDEWMGDDWTQLNAGVTFQKGFRKAGLVEKNERSCGLLVDIVNFNHSDLSEVIQNSKRQERDETKVKVFTAVTTQMSMKPKAFLQIQTAQPKVEMKDLYHLNRKQSKKKTISGELAGPSSSTGAGEDMDLGQAICRDTLKVQIPDDEITVERVYTLEDIEKFIGKEDKLRAVGQHNYSKVFNNQEWKRFKLKVNSLIANMDGWACVKAFQKIWRSHVANKRK